MEANYIEACIEALPEPKRAAARNAFHELLSEGNDESLLVRLLLVFEATAAFASAIPSAITSSMQKGAEALDARLHLLADAAHASDEDRQRQFERLAQALTEQRGDSSSLTRIAEGVEAQRVSISRVMSAVNRLRHLRVGVVLATALIAFLGGAALVAAVFQRSYKDAVAYRTFFHSMRARGVDVSVNTRGNDYMVRVEGHPIRPGTDWIKDASGKIVGAEIYFSQP